jgi:crotonobetainyl-CoA:carnitine CoA-transferase CaiB-like acyl-CoA transferase
MNNSDQVVAAPLAGIKVIDFSELLPGPFFTQSLVELGATVIKIERPPFGDNVRQMGPGVFNSVNRGKQSLVIDLKDESNRERVLSLIGTADVLVESYRPGVMARLGMDYTSLKDRYPKLIYVSLTGYGQSGPWSNLPGHDINYLAAAGVLALSGEVDGDPAQSYGLPVADLCGAMYALSSTTAALFQRHTSGVGQYLDVALADCALHWLNPRIGSFIETKATNLGEQREAALVKPAYGVFACSDDQFISIAALEDQFWLRLCKALGMHPYEGESYLRLKDRKPAAREINLRLAEIVASKKSADLFDLLKLHDVPVAPIVEPSNVQFLPQFAERKKFNQNQILPFVHYPVSLSGMKSGDIGDAPSLNNYAS